MSGWDQYADWNSLAGAATGYSSYSGGTAATGWDQYAGGHSTQGHAPAGYGAPAQPPTQTNWRAAPPPPPQTGSERGGGRGRGSTRDSSLMALADYSGNAPPSGRGGFRGGRGGGGGMDKFSGYDTTRNQQERNGGRGEKRPFEDLDSGENKRPKYKGREGREPELNLYIDPRFRYWNLPAKARVLLVSNVPQSLNSPEKLYNLFAFYGDIERIKVIRRKTDCALIEFSTATFAAIARDHLDNLIFEGIKIVVSFSRFDRVRLPHEIGVYNDGQTMDFSGPEYKMTKRYSTEELKKANMKKIGQPTNLIHISGIEVSQSVNSMMSLLTNVGARVTDGICLPVKLNKKAAETRLPKLFGYFEMATVDDAIRALANLAYSNGMKISFSKDKLAELKRGFDEKNMSMLTGNMIHK